MMDAKELGNMPAYPVAESVRDANGNPYADTCFGMSKREAFAMAAMQGLLTLIKAESLNNHHLAIKQVAEDSVIAADALLSELAKDSHE